jgi:hypothetical protein
MCQIWKIKIDMFQTLRTVWRNNINCLAPNSRHVTFCIISREKDTYSNYLTTAFQCWFLITGQIALSTQMHICHSHLRLCWCEEFIQHLTFQPYVPWQTRKTYCHINPTKFFFIQRVCQHMCIKIKELKTRHMFAQCESMSTKWDMWAHRIINIHRSAKWNEIPSTNIKSMYINY